MLSPASLYLFYPFYACFISLQIINLTPYHTILSLSFHVYLPYPTHLLIPPCTSSSYPARLPAPFHFSPFPFHASSTYFPHSCHRPPSLCITTLLCHTNQTFLHLPSLHLPNLPCLPAPSLHLPSLSLPRAIQCSPLLRHAAATPSCPKYNIRTTSK